jgi:Fe-S oxidoreductase
LLAALETAHDALAFHPAAVELVDRMVIELARGSLEYSRRLKFVDGDPRALIVVEVYGDAEAEVKSKLDSLASGLASRTTSLVRILDPIEQANVWKVRKAALPLLLGLPGDKKPIAFVEDTAVGPEKLSLYVKRFNQLLEKHGTVGSFYAHAGAGCLHIRPLINLKDARGVVTMRDLAEDVFGLVQEFGGAMSGEHGDGLARSHFNERMFGPELYRAFQEVKRAFDPEGIMNPGKVVDAPPMTESLRYGASYAAIDLPTVFPYRKEGGFARAVELCNGAAVCRKKLEGTMCPSYMVTLEEEHSTRGRANALRAVLDGRLPPEDIASERLYQVMDLCISCKACKAECPSNVDMARLKSEFLALYHRHHPFSWRDRLLVRADRVGRWGSATAPLSNWVSRRKWFRLALERVAGIDRRRSLPRFSRPSFAQWFGRPRPAGGGRRGKVVFFNDTFINYHDTEVGVAATRVLEAAGFEVALARRPCCGRPAISKGMLDVARSLARANVEALYPFVEGGWSVVGCEPSCLLSLRDEYPDLVPGREAEALSRSSFLFEEFLHREGLGGVTFPNPPREVLLHGHCHQKALVGTEPTVALLKHTGAAVTEVDSGCCGMAGSFGYEKEHFDVSLRMAERRLIPAVRSAGAATVVAAPGTSCRHQIRDGAGRRAQHPAEILARAAGLM